MTAHNGSFHKIGWYGVAMNQKRNRKRHTVYIAQSMIMQRLGSKPKGRHSGIRGRLTWSNSNRPHRPKRPSAPQMPTTKGHRPHSIPMTTCTANGGDSSTFQPTSRVPRQPTGTRLWLRIDTAPHPRHSTIIEVHYLYTDYTVWHYCIHSTL